MRGLSALQRVVKLLNRHLKGLRGGWLPGRVSLCLGLLCLCQPAPVQAICGLDAAVYAPIREIRDRGASRAWSRQILQQEGRSCVVCHLAGVGPRNAYGTALNLLLTGNDREDPARKREAGRRVSDIPANPTLPDSPTFGDLIQQGVLPASELTPELRALADRTPKPFERISVEQARELVRQVEAGSRFGILQLSATTEITSEVAEVLAGFRGEMLILGLRSMPLTVAQALAQSRAAKVWLHSITSLSADAAEAIAQVPGQLVLSGLVELLSEPLAAKLAGRQVPLSFPYLQQLTPGTAAALSRHTGSLNLGGLTEVSPDVQNILADTVGALTLPNLSSLDSLPLTRKLAAGFAQSVLLPGIRSLSVDQAREIASVKRNFFLGGVWLPLGVMTEEVATVFADSPGAGRLTLGGGPISSAALTRLVQAPLAIRLRDFESLEDAQLQILATAAASVPGGPFGRQPKLSLPGLRSVSSPLLAEIVFRSSGDFSGITTLSPAAAEALASAASREEMALDGPPRRFPFPARGLSFANLRELNAETAQRLMAVPWSSISLPEVRDVSPEILRLLVRQTSHLTLGLTRLTPEQASVFRELASNPVDLGGGIVSLPDLAELSPKSARSLVNALNRGAPIPFWGGLDKAPQLFLGGRSPTDFSVQGSCPTLTPELTAELAKYRGRLSFAGLADLSPQAAAELAAYRGPALELSGPASDQLSPATAEALARVSGTLRISLQVLDSSVFARKIGRQSSWTGDSVEAISAESIGELIQYDGFLTLRRLRVLDSVALAQRMSQNSSGQVLPALQTITPAAAEVLVASANESFLGLTVLEDPVVARVLAKSRNGVWLQRLRAATPQVVAILKEAPSITTPPLESIYLLSERQAD